MKILNVAKELIEIYQDIPHRFRSLDTNDYVMYDFDQLWSSTALGFGGVGGAAMTRARTYVLIPFNVERAYVYFGGRFAYDCPTDRDEFWSDIKRHQMADVANKERYFD